MRAIRYSVACSVDGYIAGPNGEHDWIPHDPEIDFAAVIARFDTLLVGRKTFEQMRVANRTTMPGMKTMVVSSTLEDHDQGDVSVINADVFDRIRSMKSNPGRDIWLFGGASLFGSLLRADLVDVVELAVVPVLLGGGVPLLPPGSGRTSLRLTSQRASAAGLLSLKYAVSGQR